MSNKINGEIVMSIEIHSAYIETVALIFLEVFGTYAKEVMRTGSTIVYQFKSDLLVHDLRSWEDGAKTCQLIYWSKVTVS